MSSEIIAALIQVFAAVIIAVGGGLITARYSRHSKEIADDQMLKELFTEFNQRYGTLNNKLREIETKYPTLNQLNAENERSDVLKQAVIDYFILCSEEFFWYHHKKRIDPLIWNSWQSGMLYWYSVPVIRELWEAEVKESGKASYYITDEKEFFVRT